MNASNHTFTLALVSGADVHTWDEVDLVDVFAIKREAPFTCKYCGSRLMA